jgi:hypothetical protein
MELIVLSSSSTGNGYILKSSSGESLILEAGVRLKEIKQILNFDLSGVVGVCISHSHL